VQLTSRRFTTAEREELLKLLALEPCSRMANAMLHVLERFRVMSHADRERDEQQRAAWRKAGGKLPPGRPDGARVNLAGDVYILANLYQNCTGRPIRNARAHPFWRFAQLSLRRNTDLSSVIAEVRRPPWNLGRPRKLTT
jgi:hypothetical protein